MASSTKNAAMKTAGQAGQQGQARVADPHPLANQPGTVKRRVPARKARSDAFAAIHSFASDLHSVGVIDKTTMRRFDSSCLEPPNIGAEDVKRIRSKAAMSQEVFARYLGTNKSTVQKWESADNHPSPMAQRLLNAIDKHGVEILI